MTFLYPSFLFGLLSIAIPILIHLFNFQKPKTFLFTNVKFLKYTREVSSKKLKLRHLLVLIARILFIIFLVFTFAQPFIPQKKLLSNNSNLPILLYLDNSLSMQVIKNEKSLFSNAIERINMFIEKLSPDKKYILNTNNVESLKQEFYNKNEIKERLTEIQYNSSSTEIAKVYNRNLNNSIEITNQPISAFLFSDFQKSTFDPNILSRDTNNQINLIPVNNEESSNLYIDSVWFLNPIVQENENNILKIKINNEGKKRLKNIPLQLMIDSVIQGTSSFDIDKESNSIISMNVNISGKGQKIGSINIVDPFLNFDNTFFIAINVANTINILHIYGELEPFSNKVFNSSKLFNLKSYKLDNLNYSEISNASLVILESISTMPEVLIDAMTKYSKSGGDFVVFPSSTFDLNSYNKLLKNVSIPVLSKVSVGTDSANQLSYRLIAPDFHNPFFNNIFEKQESNIEMPYSKPVFFTNGGNSILRYKTRKNFLTQYKNKESKIYISTGVLENKFSNFQINSLFVPILYKMAFGSASEKTLSYSIQDEFIITDIPEEMNTNQIVNLTAKGYNIIPEQRREGKKLIITLPKNINSGIYNLQFEGKNLEKFALNASKKESKLDNYSFSDLKTIFAKNKNINVYEGNLSNEFFENYKKDNLGISLWKYSLMLCLLFLFCEIILIRFL